MATTEHFKVSSYLKDIIGRDLVTNEFVAVFELVKNAFDAKAKRVDIAFDLINDELWIVDNGKGMDEAGVKDRWLFVAYSAKADGSEDEEASQDYRNKIKPQGQYAGSKGIGRFSCDTLGAKLELYSREKGSNSVQRLDVEWAKFEANSKKLFQNVNVTHDDSASFPTEAPVKLPKKSGTILRIKQLRMDWDADDIGRLRRYLEKLIDPFGTTKDTPVYISVVSDELDDDEIKELSGKVGNDLQELLAEKTTRIVVDLEGDSINTELIDRGRTIYRIREANAYDTLDVAKIRIEIFYLNRSAKHTFTSRMKVRPIEFGSVFLFLNGFRIFPIGEETDDTLGLNRRKQQGTSRYLGTRDIMGRVDVTAPHRMFREASSRDAGLIEDARSRELFDAIRRKAIFRLERYVVGVTWPDKADMFREDASGLRFGETKGRVAQIIANLAATKDLELLYFDPEIVDLVDDDVETIDGAIKSLTAIAERQGDERLLERIEGAKARIAELEKAEAEAAQAAKEAREAKARADARIEKLERQAKYLASTQDLTVEQMTLLLHQVMIYSGHIGAAIDRSLKGARVIVDAAVEIAESVEDEDLEDAAAAIRSRARRVADDLDYIHLENDRLIAVARFASNARFDLETDLLEGDVIAFLDEYVNQVRGGRDATSTVVFDANGLELFARFRPVDLVVVVDNLLDNARKHGARMMTMEARKGSKKGSVHVAISDDGRGINEQLVDPERIFEKGYSSTAEGTGLGLYHAKKVMEDMGGGLILDARRHTGRVEFAMILPEPKK
ncbi:ATP-binding protein [Erythrobacter litoralis]|uniref:ATP-binding protein n=1 Tax=Erythrobacter litoralis TaxID=39960 RepID=UPI0024359546|nr:ATP-binding protein [Erythrobacter litoralis]MDG6077894.1 ATP-binding protein [Erythrobacter litoralis]